MTEIHPAVAIMFLIIALLPFGPLKLFTKKVLVDNKKKSPPPEDNSGGPNWVLIVAVIILIVGVIFTISHL